MSVRKVGDVVRVLQKAKKREDVAELVDVGINPNDITRSPQIIAADIQHSVDEALRVTGVNLNDANVVDLKGHQTTSGAAAAGFTDQQGNVTLGGETIARDANSKQTFLHEAAHAAFNTNISGEKLSEEAHEGLADSLAGGGPHQEEQRKLSKVINLSGVSRATLHQAYLSGDGETINRAYQEAENPTKNQEDYRRAA